MELDKKSDLELIKKIKEEASSDAYLELKKRVEKCYYKTCELYCKRVPYLKYYELIEDVDFVLNKSIKNFNLNKNTKFSSWATSMSRYHVLNTIKKLNELGCFISTENTELDILNNAFNKVHVDQNDDLKNYLFSIIDNIKDKRTRKIFELRFFNDKNSSKWKNIAKDMKLSVQQTVNIYNSAKAVLYKEMKKENSI